MKTLCLDLPTMYGDHHVTEVRRLLMEATGVSDVYASSAFHAVEVSFDEGATNEEALKAILEAAGYLGEIPAPVEMGATAYHAKEGEPYFRHTAVYETTKQVVSFTQKTPYLGRPLWPCPGMGPLGKKEE